MSVAELARRADIDKKRLWYILDGQREAGRCMTPIGSYAERYIEIRSNSSVSKDTIANERRYLRYVDAAIGDIPICKVTAEDVERCLLMVPELSEKWALERQAAWEENRKTARGAKKHGTLGSPSGPSGAPLRSHRRLHCRYGAQVD